MGTEAVEMPPIDLIRYKKNQHHLPHQKIKLYRCHRRRFCSRNKKESLPRTKHPRKAQRTCVWPSAERESKRKGEERMNTDIEKGQKENYEKEPPKDEKADDTDLKKDPDAEEPAEDSPLKGKEASMENDATAPSGEKAKEGAKGLREWLSKSRVKWWIAILVAIVLLTVVLVGTLLAVEDDDYDIPDNSIRLVKLWPRPNKPRNIINFVHGSLPIEGRVWPDLTKQLDELLIRYQPSANRSRNVVDCSAESKSKTTKSVNLIFDL
ncbi:hypothetical protein CDAR_321231 [Caerostris darwini]|uniref:Uncharacterized protein n=1 Tax=Caerostris darwini TaxID=1538125 RepID=A0AAV4TA98_9ARAC|nr:hypothetical protein CDAR_321231 [Caerostris darwini]